MPEGRPAIPAELKRRVLMEAGHRCAIPTCRTVPVVIAHIDPYAEVRGHSFENLIALCPTCHARYDGGDIDRLSMRAYKANLGLVSGRYGETERRILDSLARHPEVVDFGLPSGFGFLLMYLIQDGLLEMKVTDNSAWIDGRLIGQPVSELYHVTDSGREFIKRWLSAEPVSPEVEDGSA